MLRRISTITLFAAGALLGLTACSTPPEPYYRLDDHYLRQQVEFNDEGPQIEVGRRIWILDGLNHYLLSLPSKILLLNWSYMDHRLPAEDKAVLEEYLEFNRLSSVKVRHNQYAPFSEFRRLVRNRAVGWPYRYTLGLVAWLQYTLIPDRLFGGLYGGDHFNPFTNTVNVYSSDLAILLHEAGHAKDYTGHDSKGTSFVLLRSVPGVDLIQEGAASADAVRFLHCFGYLDEEVDAYPSLIPAYSTYVGSYAPGGLVGQLVAVVAGHVAGLVRFLSRAKATARPQPATDGFLPPWCQEARRMKAIAEGAPAGGAPSDLTEVKP